MLRLMPPRRPGTSIRGVPGLHIACAATLAATLIAPIIAPLCATASTAVSADGAAPEPTMDWSHGHHRRPPAPRDPLVPMLRRVDRYFQRHEVDGVVMDSRYVLNASEAARLSVISQLLGYEELYKVHRSRRIRRDIVDRADYLIANLALVHSGSVFDGMLGDAFLEAYDATQDPRYLRAGSDIVNEIEALPGSERVLNGGLMGALALAKYFRLTGDPSALGLTREILSIQPPYQHKDGSFPHWCPCSKDVSYTGWMSMELILIQRLLDDPVIDPMLAGARRFLEARIDDHGEPHYQEPCPDYPGCTLYYYSVASGCGIDYDTRAFTNELGYYALLFDRLGSPEYGPVMGFLRGLESGGTWADKWDFWPSPDDPYYPWTIADTSVVNTSVLFWSLASVLSGRPRHSHGHDDEDGDEWDDGGDGDVAQQSTDASPQDVTIAEPAARPRGRIADDPSLTAPAGTTHATAPPWSAVNRLWSTGAPRLDYCDESAAAAGADVPASPGGTGPAGTPGRRALPGSQSPAISPDALGLAGSDRVAITPNPMREVAEVRLTGAVPGPAFVAILDAMGRRVRLLSDPGLSREHRLLWDGRDESGRPCPNGLYFVRATGGSPSTARMLLVR